MNFPQQTHHKELLRASSSPGKKEGEALEEPLPGPQTVPATAVL